MSWVALTRPSGTPRFVAMALGPIEIIVGAVGHSFASPSSGPFPRPIEPCRLTWERTP